MSVKNTNPKFISCTRCVLDTTDDPSISFDDRGICNHCIQYDAIAKRPEICNDGVDTTALISEIKLSSKKKKYHCIAGASGGIDSTFALYKLKEFGLNPLVVHLDNGWNSSLATQNIQNAVSRLGFDLYTHVIDWNNMRDLHLAFLKASVVDIELPTDHAIAAILYKIALQFDLKHIVTGVNHSSEGVLPTHWVWGKMDWLNIKDIHQKHGTLKLTNYPHLNFWLYAYCVVIKKIKQVSILDVVKYDKRWAQDILIKELQYIPYENKHDESVFTCFYQNYILPTKFNIDKRKAHLSSLICAKQITKAKALEELSNNNYLKNQMYLDKDYVLKKLSLSNHDFEALMNLPINKHEDYDTYFKKHYRYHKFIFDLIRPIKGVLK